MDGKISAIQHENYGDDHFSSNSETPMLSDALMVTHGGQFNEREIRTEFFKVLNLPADISY
jgi:hypothetical protein